MLPRFSTFTSHDKLQFGDIRQVPNLHACQVAEKPGDPWNLIDCTQESVSGPTLKDSPLFPPRHTLRTNPEERLQFGLSQTKPTANCLYLTRGEETFFLPDLIGDLNLQVCQLTRVIEIRLAEVATHEVIFNCDMPSTHSDLTRTANSRGVPSAGRATICRVHRIHLSITFV